MATIHSVAFGCTSNDFINILMTDPSVINVAKREVCNYFIFFHVGSKAPGCWYVVGQANACYEDMTTCGALT